MNYQPPSRTRFYLDRRHKKVMGVCAGIANYTGLDVTLVRIMMASAMFMSGGSVLPLYFIAGWIADDQPREMSYDDGEQRRFWQGVRASPAQSARDIRSRFRDIDRRLGDIEYFVTSENRSLAKEIEELR
jgi:phage shock protein C